MDEQAYEPLITNVLRILTKNGYPAKRVALPLDRMYEVAYEKGLNFNKALEILKAKGIDHEKTTEKIIFFPDGDMADMMAKAQEMLAKMSDGEKAELMQKAKEMGFL